MKGSVAGKNATDLSVPLDLIIFYPSILPSQVLYILMSFLSMAKAIWRNYTHTHIHTHTHTQKHTHTIHTPHTDTHKHTHIHPHTHMHSHTHTHTYTHTCKRISTMYIYRHINRGPTSLLLNCHHLRIQ